MIAKHISMKAVRKSSFGELVRYITDHQSKATRIETVRVTNCINDTPEWAAAEVFAVQQQNKRAQSDKTYHLLVSFPAGEQPSPDALRTVEDRLCAALGYDGHQRVSAVHNDTDHLHIHIAINKIHPDRLTLHEPFRDYKTLADECERIEADLNLRRLDHTAKKRLSHNRAQDMEHMTGIESLLGYLQRDLAPSLTAAQTWDQLDRVLSDNGLALMRKGNGFVIADAGGRLVKASSVHSSLSKNKLEARLGPRLAEPTPAPGRNRSRPLKSRQFSEGLYAAFQDDMRGRLQIRAEEGARLRSRQAELIEAVKRGAALKRATIKFMRASGLERKILNGLVSRNLRAAIKKINADQKRSRQQLYERSKRVSWLDWLKDRAHQGDAEALAAIRSKATLPRLRSDIIVPANSSRGTIDPRGAAVVTKNGTLVFKARNTFVRDTGDRLAIDKTVDEKSLATVLQLARERYGRRLNAEGSDQFKERLARVAAASRLDITFDDAALEARRRHLAHTLEVSTNEQRNTTGRRADGGLGNAGAIRGSARTGGAVAGGFHAAVHRADSAGDTARTKAFTIDPVRTLSAIPMVRGAGKAAVLLPNDAHNRLDHRGADADRTLRRAPVAPGLGAVAADRYIAEREEKRAKGFDIPKHVRYNPGIGGPAAFAGVRKVGDQNLALLQRGQEIQVMPIDKATAQRLSRVSVGDKVTLTPAGSIKRKGQSR